MSPQYMDAVTWGHHVADSEEKALRIIDLTKSVAKFEQNQDGCGFYVVLSPLEGQHFSQPTRLEIILNHTQDYIKTHEASEPSKQLQNAIEKEKLLSKPASVMSFTPKAGFLQRQTSSDTPIKDQFIRVAKLDAKPDNYSELLEAIKIHASNIERTEDETLSFLVLESHDSKNSITLLERYTSERYFNDVHSGTQITQEFRKKTAALMDNEVIAGFRAVAGFVDERERLDG